jgi:hypothetical protein
MKASNVNIKLGELEKFKKRNAEERLKFIEFWANYIKTHSDKEWSEQQNKLIDSQIKMAQRLVKKHS